MKFLKSGFNSILARSAIILMLAFALLSTSSATIFADTITETSKTATTSPSASSASSKRASAPDGRRIVPYKQSTERPERFTNIIDYETFRFLETNRRSSLNSADRTGLQSNLSEISIISISANSQITRASRCGSFSWIDISKTAPPCSDASRVTSWKIFGEQPGRSFGSLLTDRLKLSFKPPLLAFEIGRTSAVFPRREFSSPVSWQRSIRGQPMFAVS